MIGLLCSFLALALAVAVRCREKRHAPVVWIYLASLANALGWLAGVDPRPQLLLLAGVSYATAEAYRKSWTKAPRWPLAALGALVAAYVCFAPRPSLWWRYALEGPLVASAVFGVAARARRTTVAPPSVTTTSLTVLLLGDLAGIALLRVAPASIALHGVAQTTFVAAVQAVWLLKKRGSK